MIYESSAPIKLLVVAIAIVFVSLCALGVLHLGLTSYHDVYGIAALLAGGAMGVDFLLVTLRRRLCIYPERFEYRWELGEFSGQRDQIRGYRVLTSRYTGSRLRFYLNFPDNRSFIVRDDRSNPFFSGWMDAIPDLDQQEQEAYQAALLENPVFGTDKKTRIDSLRKQKKALTVLNCLGCLLAAWLYFYPGAASLLACISYPLAMLVVAMFSGGRYASMWDYNNPKLKLTFAIFVPALMLGLRAFIDTTILDKAEAILPAGLVALGMLLLLMLIDQRPQTRILALFGVLLWIGAWGGLLAYNKIKDSSTAEIFRTVISSKKIRHGSKGGEFYELEVASIQVAGVPDELDTNASFYAQSYEGETLCLNLHSGSLGYRWYDFGTCQARVKTVNPA